MSRLRHWLFAAALASAAPGCLVDHSGLTTAEVAATGGDMAGSIATGGVAAVGSQVGGAGQAGTSAISQGASGGPGGRTLESSGAAGVAGGAGGGGTGGRTLESSAGAGAAGGAVSSGAAGDTGGSADTGGALSDTSDTGADAGTEPTDADRCAAEGGSYSDGTCVIDCSAVGICGIHGHLPLPGLLPNHLRARWMRRWDRLQQGRRLRHRLRGFQVLRGNDQLCGQLVCRELWRTELMWWRGDQQRFQESDHLWRRRGLRLGRGLHRRLVRIDLLGEQGLHGRDESVLQYGHGQLHGPEVVSGEHGLRVRNLPDRLHGPAKLPEQRLLLGGKLHASAFNAPLRSLVSNQVAAPGRARMAVVDAVVS